MHQEIMRSDIHSSSKRLQSYQDKIRESTNIHDANKLSLLKFIDYCTAAGLAPATISKHLIFLRHLDRILHKDFAACKVDDLVKACGVIERKDEWSFETKRNFKITLKKFFKWLRKSEYYPEEVRWIVTSKKNMHRHPDILSEDEILQLVKAADNIRNKALIMTLYESGCRIGELLSLKISNVHFEEIGIAINVVGKTGPRRILLVSSVPLLTSWLENHPLRDDPDANVWVTKYNKLNRNDEYSPLGPAAVGDLLDKLAKKAGIKKRIYPHLFRHSRATHLATKLTEAQMKQLFGWTQGSSMAAIYVHLSGRDVDNALLELHGLRTQAQNEPKIKLKICPRCNEHNSPDAKYCKRCAFVLDVETFEWENKVMDQLLKEPKVSRYLTKMLRQVVAKK